MCSCVQAAAVGKRLFETLEGKAKAWAYFNAMAAKARAHDFAIPVGFLAPQFCLMLQHCESAAEIECVLP
eukprot:SAG31_NODE_32154_length_359_cov_0.950000_1_plen_69_part_10